MKMTEYDHAFVILAWNDIKIKEKMLIDREQVLYCTNINEVRFGGEILNNVLIDLIVLFQKRVTGYIIDLH